MWLSNWNIKPLPDKTWPNLKTNFRDAQTELNDIYGPTMQQAGYHHANMLAQRLRETIDTQDTEMLAMPQDFQQSNTPIRLIYHHHHLLSQETP